jgi:hypothetical protein
MSYEEEDTCMAYEEEDTHREANTHAIADTAVNGGVASPALAKILKSQCPNLLGI